LFADARHGEAPPVGQVRELVAYVREHRDAPQEAPFDIVLGGASPTGTAEAQDLLGPLAEAGATWWDERQLQGGAGLDKLGPVLRRVEQGPPA
ncbi:luciferase, partial [Streptomyces sp. AcH 505]